MAKHNKKEKKKMNKITSYDSENDILVVHKGFSDDEKFKGNITIGDLVLDMSTKSRIRGIEVMNASKFFDNFRIEKGILENIRRVTFDSAVRQDGIILKIVFTTVEASEIIPATIAVPMQTN